MAVNDQIGIPTSNVLQRLLTRLGTLTASPWAVLIVASYIGVWWIVERETFDFHAIATIATWLMTLLIQRAEHRDAQAVHAKLDELLHAQKNASNDMALIDDLEPEDIEAHRNHARSPNPKKN
jgi:low affinity Fe/Cu permease